MHAIVTVKLLTTRFYLTEEGWYSDIPNRARKFPDLTAAELAAANVNAESDPVKLWHAANVLADGSLVVPA